MSVEMDPLDGSSRSAHKRFGVRRAYGATRGGSSEDAFTPVSPLPGAYPMMNDPPPYEAPGGGAAGGSPAAPQGSPYGFLAGLFATRVGVPAPESPGHASRVVELEARAARVREMRSLRYVVGWRFLLLSLASLGVVLCLVAIMVFTTRDRAIDESRDSLRKQVRAGALDVLQDAGSAFEFQIVEGVVGFLLPSLYTMTDAQLRPATYSYSAVPRDSYADTNTTSPRRVVAEGGDPRFPGLRINTSTSVVFFTDQSTEGVESKWSSHEDSLVKPTSHVDAVLPPFFASTGVWAAFYVGTETGPMFRFYPGQVSNREATNYDPRGRPWYAAAHTQAKQVRSTQPDWEPMLEVLPPLHHTSPYRSASRGVWMITVAKAMYTPTQCFSRGLPECIDAVSDANFFGVAAIDMYIAEVRELVARLQSRASGVAYLYVASTNDVVVAPQWSASITDLVGMSMLDVPLPKTSTRFSSSVLTRMRNTPDSGSIEFAGNAIAFKHIVGGRYTIAMATPLDEITQPIDSTADEIRSSSLETFLVVLLVLAVALVVEVLLIGLVSHWLSKPLVVTADEAERVTGNIGADLLDGVDHADATSGTSCLSAHEVYQVRRSYLHMLHRLSEMRERRDDSAIANPLHRAPALEDVAAPSEAVLDSTAQLIADEQVQLRVREDGARPEPSRKWPHLRLQTALLVQLALPTVLVLVVVITVSGVTMKDRVRDWIDPVRDTMIAEEKNNFPVRADTLRDQLESLLRRAAFSMDEYARNIELVWNHVHGLPTGDSQFRLKPTGYPLFYSPDKSGSPFPAMADSLVTTHPRFPNAASLDSNMQTAVFYQNGNSGYARETGYARPWSAMANWDAVATLQANLSHTDNIARAHYFANDLILQMYFGLEDTESMRLFPYRPVDSYETWSGTCAANGHVRTGYSPVCRPWYTLAKDAPDALVWNPLSVSASTGLLLGGLSKALHDANGDLIGVAAIDFSIDVVRARIERSTLYERGYAYMIDADGNTVLHPRVDVGSGAITSIVSLEYAGCDGTAFGESILPRMLARESGDEVHARCDEDWLLSWRPVNGTTYIVAITVPLSDLEMEPRRLVEDIEGTLDLIIGFSVAFMCVVVLAGVYLSRRLSQSISVVLEDLLGYIKKLHDTQYAVDVPSTENKLGIVELARIQDGMRDLLVALRFGNGAFANGNLQLVLDNYLEALAIVEQNEFPRGLGVCLANVGNTARLMRASNKQPNVDPSTYLVASMRNAHENQALDALGQRLFNYALLMFAQGDEAAGDAAMEDVHPIHHDAATRTVAALSAYAYSLALLYLDNQAPYAQRWAQNFAEAALEVARSPAVPMQATELAKCCFALGVAGQRPEFHLWALAHVPRANVFVVARLAAHSKMYADQPLMSAIDARMREAERIEWAAGPIDDVDDAFRVLAPADAAVGGDARAKRVQFCLDVSGSMAGTRIDTCKASISAILADVCDEVSDEVGLVVFNNRVSVNSDLGARRPSALRVRVGSIKVGGRTAFFDALIASVLSLRSAAQRGSVDDKVRSNWLVALTDGDDNSSDASPADVCALLRNTEVPINVALITVGELGHETMESVQNIRDVAENLGNTAFLIRAGADPGAISSAFERVGRALADSGAVMTEFL